VASREAALASLATLLDTISTANGYTLDVKRVTRQFMAIDEMASTELPAIIIEDDGSEDIIRKTGDFADVSFVVSVIGYVNAAAALSTAMNELDLAIKKAVASDRTLGGTVAHVLIEPQSERSGTQFQPYGWFNRPLKIMYEGRYSEGL